MFLPNSGFDRCEMVRYVIATTTGGHVYVIATTTGGHVHVIATTTGGHVYVIATTTGGHGLRRSPDDRRILTDRDGGADPAGCIINNAFCYLLVLFFGRLRLFAVRVFGCCVVGTRTALMLTTLVPSFGGE